MRERERQRETEIERQTDRETERERAQIKIGCFYKAEMHLTCKQLLGLLLGLGESVEHEALVLAGHGVQLVAVEADDELVLDAAAVILPALGHLVQQLLRLHRPPIVILRVLRVGTARLRLLAHEVTGYTL